MWWLRNATATFDEQWESHGFTGPYNPFPDKEYIDWIFAFLNADNEWLRGHGLPEDLPGKKRRAFTKSRTVLLSWSVIGDSVHKCQTVPSFGVLLQSLNQEKANALLKYAKMLWYNQAPWLKEHFPLSRRYEDLSESKIEWDNGSYIMAVPQGEHAIRQFHPSRLVMDEAAFQPEGETAVDTALPAVVEAILLSSAYPGWYAEFVDSDEFEEDVA